MSVDRKYWKVIDQTEYRGFTIAVIRMENGNYTVEVGSLPFCVETRYHLPILEKKYSYINSKFDKFYTSSCIKGDLPQWRFDRQIASDTKQAKRLIDLYRDSKSLEYASYEERDKAVFDNNDAKAVSAFRQVKNNMADSKYFASCSCFWCSVSRALDKFRL